MSTEEAAILDPEDFQRAMNWRCSWRAGTAMPLVAWRPERPPANAETCVSRFLSDHSAPAQGEAIFRITSSDGRIDAAVRVAWVNLDGALARWEFEPLARYEDYLNEQNASAKFVPSNLVG